MRTAFTQLTLLTKRHPAGIFFALLVGAIVLAPQVIFMVAEGEHYQGLYMMKTEAEPHYLALMREYVDEGKVNNPFLYEHKYYGPAFFATVAEEILAFPARFLPIGIPALNLVHKFVLPAITFLLIYALVFRLTGSRSWSVAAGLGVILGNVLFYYSDLMRLLKFDLSYNQFIFNRPVNPQFSAPLFYLYANLLLSAYEKKTWKWFAAVAGVFALTYYTYFYSFTFLFTLNVVFIVLWFYFGDRLAAKRLAVASIVGTLLGLPELWTIYSVTQHPDYQIIRELNWLTPSHMPEVSKNALLGALTFGVTIVLFKRWGRLRWEKARILFISGLLLAPFAVINQQVLTGITLQSGHYHWIYTVPIVIISLMIVGYLWTKDRMEGTLPENFVARCAPWLLCTLFIGVAFILQYSSYRHWSPIVHEEQRYMPALRFIDAETPKDAVVMANDDLGDLIPVFTGANLLWKEAGNHILCCYLVPPERRAFTVSAVLAAPDPLRAITSSPYRVDYILWDRQANPDWKIDTWGLPRVFGAEGMEVYQLPAKK